MAKNYTIAFKSLRAGDAYTLSIGGGTGTAVALKGGAQPFTTQEDDNEDMFAPVRTQTGYLRIVDDGKLADGTTAFDWHDLIPETDTSRPVTLTKTSGGTTTTCWVGFMQAQDFGSTLYGNPQEREFPVHCVLTVTQGTDINYQQTAIQNFAYLLKQIVDAIPSAQRPTQIVVQGGRDAQTWLLKRIDWQNFVSRNDGAQAARFSCFECLEDMCAFWGWTARTKGQTLYLTAADDSSLTTWLTMTYAQLTTMAGGTAAGSTTGTWDSVSFDTLGDVYASVNNDDYVQRGYNKAVVSADTNSADDYIVDPFDELLEKDMKDCTYAQGYDVGAVHYTQDVLSFSRWWLDGSCVQNYASFNYASNYNNEYGNVLRIKKSYSSGSVFASFETKYEHVFHNGIFMILGTVYRPNNDKYEKYDTTEGRWKSGNADCWIHFGVGKTRGTAKWWNGKEWVNSVTNCRLTLGNSDEQMYTRWWTGSVFDTAIESNIISASNLSGLIFIDILGSNSTVVGDIGGEKLFDIMDFRVEFLKNDTITKVGPYPNSGYVEVTDLNRPSSFEYTSSNQNKVRSEFDVDCIYGSDDAAPMGYGTLLNESGNDTYLTTMTFPGSNTAKHPEQHLADRVTAYWATSKRRMSVEVKSDVVGEIGPKTKVTIDGTTGHAISVSREWRDDVMGVTVLETE